MRPVLVEQHAGPVVEVVRVAADVVAPVHDEAAAVLLAGQPFGQHRARESRADDQEVKHGKGQAAHARRSSPQMPFGVGTGVAH